MATVNLSSYGGVADWVPAVGGGSGTDNYTAFGNAMAAAGPGGTVVVNFTGNVGVVVDAAHYLYLANNNITIKGLSETGTKLYLVRPSTDDGIGLYIPAGNAAFATDITLAGNERTGYTLSYAEAGSGKLDLARARVEGVNKAFFGDPGASFYAVDTRISHVGTGEPAVAVLITTGIGSQTPTCYLRRVISTHASGASSGYEHCFYLNEGTIIDIDDLQVTRCGGYGIHMFGGIRDTYRPASIVNARFNNCYVATIADFGKPQMSRIQVVCNDGDVVAAGAIHLQSTQRGTLIDTVKITGSANTGILESGIGTRGSYLAVRNMVLDGSWGIGAIARTQVGAKGLWTFADSYVRSTSGSGGAFLQDVNNLNVETWFENCRLESSVIEAATVRGGKVRFLDCSSNQVSYLNAVTGPVEWDYTPGTSLFPNPATIGGAFAKTLRPFNPGAGVGHYRPKG